MVHKKFDFKFRVPILKDALNTKKVTQGENQLLVGFYLDPAQEDRLFGQVERGRTPFKAMQFGAGSPPGKMHQKRMEAVARIRSTSSRFKKYPLTSPVEMIRGEREE